MEQQQQQQTRDKGMLPLPLLLLPLLLLLLLLPTSALQLPTFTTFAPYFSFPFFICQHSLASKKEWPSL